MKVASILRYEIWRFVPNKGLSVSEQFLQGEYQFSLLNIITVTKAEILRIHQPDKGVRMSGLLLTYYYY